jgi:Rrf2 family transcriptional regulator, iron-sulfur cluster assembly transcription factor
MLALPQTVGHAILALSCLESCSTNGFRLAKDVAACTQIPLPYLSKILHTLGRSGLVAAKRGYRGGFSLTRPAGDISLREVTEAIDPKAVEKRCLLGLAVCTDERACPAHARWSVERQRLEDILERLTIADVAAFEWNSTSGHCRRHASDPSLLPLA